MRYGSQNRVMQVGWSLGGVSCLSEQADYRIMAHYLPPTSQSSPSNAYTRAVSVEHKALFHKELGIFRVTVLRTLKMANRLFTN